MTWLLVIAGAMVGAPARFLVDRWVQRLVAVNHPARIPIGTLTVNVIGSGVLGVADARMTGWSLLLVGVGFCGSFTTFSTFAALTEESIRAGWRPTAWANMLISVAACYLMFFAAFTMAGGTPVGSPAAGPAAPVGTGAASALPG